MLPVREMPHARVADPVEQEVQHLELRQQLVQHDGQEVKREAVPGVSQVWQAYPTTSARLASCTRAHSGVVFQARGLDRHLL